MVQQQIDFPHDSYFDTMAKCEHRIGMTVLRIKGETEVNIARTKLANMALNRGAEVTLWVDCDNAPSVQTVVHLIQQAVERQRPQGAVYCRQANATTEQRNPTTLCLHPSSPGKWNFGDRSETQSVKWTGFGCLAIPRASYEAVRDQCPEVEFDGDPTANGPHWFMPQMVGKTYLHDDLGFCAKLSQAGVQIDVCSGHHVVHWKTVGLMPPGNVSRVSHTGTVSKLPFR